MSNWRRWVRPGLAATIVLAFFAVLLRSGAVERDISARVAERLNADGFDWAHIVVSGRGVEIDGVAPAPELQKEAVASAAAVPGVASVVDRSGLLPVASPYVWSARRTGSTVRLGGSVPSEANRNSVLAAARRALPDAEILDETRLARGASTAFNSATTFALERLADLSDGLVTITDGTLAVAGVAANSDRYNGAREALTDAIPAGVTLGPVDISPPRADPFVWSASLEEGSVTLAGFVPNDVVKSELADEARSVLAGVTIIDNMNIASGEPKGFADAAKFAITALGRLRGGGVMLDGLTLDVAGVARSVDDYEAVVNGIGGKLPPGLEIVANSITPAPVSDYGWSGKRHGDTVTLSGYVPSLQDRAEVQQVADELFAGAAVTDGVRVAAGEPKMDWIGAIKFAMGQLAQLKSGAVALGDKTYSIEGEAADSKAYLALTSANARTLPASMTLVTSDVSAPRASPYTLSLGHSADGLILAGYAPSPDDKQAILDAARSQFGPLKIDDEISFASGAPEDFVDAVVGAMQAAARLAGGSFKITDSIVDVEGTTFGEGARKRTVSLAEDMIPDTFKTEVNIVTRQIGQPLDAAECRTRVGAVLGQGRVEFDKGATDISSASYPLLDRISGILMRCPQSPVEVGGYSDSDGSEENNLALTQARAEAVLDYLVDAGVRFERLKAVGHGEANPIADNSTEEGKAANRRIEFTIGPVDGG